jgi:hypothetical protein
MSFGLKSFKKQKDESKHSEGRKHIPTVIIGHDLAAVLKLVELKNTLSPENLCLITPRFLTRQGLVETYQAGVSTLRDNVTTLQIAGKFSQARTVRYDHETHFAKEGQWQRFGGRAKPMELAPGEAYFQSPRQDLELASLFSESDWEQLDETLKTYQQVRILEKLEKQAPTDLANRDEWWLLFHDLGEVTCSELWVSLPARQVLKASEQGQTLPTEAAAWLASVKRQAAIALSWEMTKELHPEPRTLFVPQSMTHEWGHFILDVLPWDEARRCHPVNALILLHDEEPTSELMADKIKLCKRVLERVLPDFEKHIRREYIIASEDYLEWPSQPELAEALLVSVPSLHLLGAYAAQSGTEKFLSRALLTL